MRDGRQDDAGDYARFREYAVGLLSRREHSEKELRGKLRSRGADPGAVDSVVAELKGRDYLSDDRFTEGFVRGRMQRGYGPVKIRQELGSRGVDDALIDRYLDQPEEAWEALLREVWLKKYRGATPVGYREWARQARYFQGRGFTPDQIRQVIDFEEAV